MSAPKSSGRHRYGRRERGVDGERDARVVRDLRQRLEVGDRAGRVGHDLGVDELGAPGLDRVGEGLRVVGRDERRLDAEPAQGHVEQRVGAAVERARGDDVIAGVAQLGEQQRLGRLARAGGDRADAALEARDPLLERRDGRIAEPRVDVPVLLQREQIGCILGVFKHERGGLIDGYRARARRRVRARAGVDCAGAQPPIPVLGVAHWALTLLRRCREQVRRRTFSGERCIAGMPGDRSGASRGYALLL